MITPANVFQAQIKEMFTKRVPTETEYLFKIAELILYQNFKSTDSFGLYSLLGMENFSKLVNYVDGKPIKLPTKKELEESLITAILYYEKEIKGLDWKDIKTKYNEFDLTSTKYTCKIRNLNETIKRKIDEYFKE